MNRNESLAHDLLEAGNEHFQMAIHPRRVLFWTADSNGGCEVVSPNWTEFTGQPLAEAHGAGWLAVVFPEDRARVVEALRFSIDAQRGFYLHYRVSGPDCLIRRVLHDASVRLLPSGKFNGLIGTLTDESDCAVGEQMLQQSMQQVYEFLDGVKLAAIAIDAKGQLVHVNPVMAAQVGQGRGALIGCDWIGQHVTAEDRQRLYGLFDGNTPLSALPHEFEFQVETVNGSRLYRWHLTLIRDYAGELANITMMGTDITEWRLVGNQMRLTAQICENLSEAMVITDHQNRILSVNQAFTTLTGYSREEALGNNPRILQSGRHDAEFYQSMWQCIVKEGHWRGDIWDRRKDGSCYPKFLAITAVRDASGAITNFSAIFYDVSERKQLEERLETLAHYDTLTGLPNRMLLQDRLEQIIARSERYDQHFALLFIDLDGFKPVNDCFGHAIGDELLKLVSQRLNKAVRGMDTVARLGGDEFVVILTDVGGSENAVQVAENIVANLSEPYEVAGETITVSASIGVSLYPKDEMLAPELLRAADEAMYQAKRDGKQRVVFYGSVF
jgi:diguanylate cyclase (GGDEF)-like protein/PAS domain S-box-containing protein